jgi:hypothetical protein
MDEKYSEDLDDFGMMDWMYWNAHHGTKREWLTVVDAGAKVVLVPCSGGGFLRSLHDSCIPPEMTQAHLSKSPRNTPTLVTPVDANMAPSPCALCHTNRALILRPKDHSKLCKTCFITVFETEIHHTITANALFTRGERVAIGASGGKDSTVLASVLKTLNERYDYGLDLILLSIDEGIKGYRDDSLETVKRNAEQYEMDLTILGYAELYGWTMDQVVEQVGKKGNCTYCGVFRRQALDRGAARLGVKHVVTGHNADDVAETVLMNCETPYL